MSRGTTKVYSSGATRKVSAFHLGSAADQISGHSKPQDAAPYKGQSYQQIKQQCLKDGVLFEDPEFKAENKSLFFSREPPRPFTWKRPKELTSNPKLFVGGASRFDITQGMLGDCWLLAAIASLTQYQTLLYQVVPPDQDFEGKDYCGIFRFRFWQYGRWEEVVVDDRLPTYNNQLVFVHSSEGREFWSALLEKAYAKLNGSYESLKGGQTSEAMEDFTGGVTETFQLREKTDKKLFQIMLKAVARQSLMCCSIEAKPNEIEAKLDNGLVKGHAYSVTGVKKVNARSRSGQIQVNLVRVRNPWGNEREWHGAWGDKSPEWGLLSDAEKKNIGLSFDDDGEFWMSFEDFSKEFTRLEVCMLSPDSAGDVDRKTWAMNLHQGSWQKKVSAGGCRNFPDSFALNPQYKIKLEDPDSDDEDDLCTVVVGLIQKDRRKKKKLGAQNLTIGFSIYKLEDDADQYKDHDRYSKDYFLYHKSTARSKNFINGREVAERFNLHPGSYLVIPSTFKPDEEGDFLVRLFSEKAAPADAVDTQTTIEYKPTKDNNSLNGDSSNNGDLTEAPSAEQSKQMDAKFQGFFNQVAGSDEEIDSFELQQVMTMAFKKEFGSSKEFSLESARSMVAMVDRDRSGKLNFTEFKDLWHTVMQWKNVFKDYDKDKSGDMDAIELRNALSKLGLDLLQNNLRKHCKLKQLSVSPQIPEGFKLSTPALSSLVLRYANKKGHVSYDDFMQICCRIRSCFESYLSYQGRSFTLDDYIQSAIYT